MIAKHNYLFCNYNIFGFKEKHLQEGFNEWQKSSNLKQISAISTVTALLYIVASYINRIYVPADILPLMIFVHLYLIPSILFVIAILAYLKKRSCFMHSLLIAAPIIAAIGNILIVSKYNGYTIHQAELYLSIFWIFTVSGLRYIHAINSALAVFVIGIVGPYFMYPITEEEFVMHIFWMLASFSFGLVGAYLLQSSQKTLYLKNKELEENAITDKLTGLYNRKKLDEVMLNELDKSRRYGRYFGVMMLDVDYFKDVNDTYGHQVGDSVLIEFTTLIKKNTRSSDVLIRWGGEEFIIISLEVDKKSIISLAENIRKKIEQSTFKTVGSKTASIGVTLNKSSDDINSIIKRSDQALYKAKNAGRNRVEFLA